MTVPNPLAVVPIRLSAIVRFVIRSVELPAGYIPSPFTVIRLPLMSDSSAVEVNIIPDAFAFIGVVAPSLDTPI
jgi:hypothetical protein